MADNEPKLAWGIKDGHWLHINDAPRGRGCNSVCPDCGSPLIAKKGSQKDWHFAHLTQANCQGESVLHKLGKHAVVALAKQSAFIHLPSHIDEHRAVIACYSDAPDQHVERLQQAREEVRDGQLIYDVLAQGDAYEHLVIEIHVTHAKSPSDIQTFRQSGRSAIEVDLSALAWNATYDEIESQVQTFAPRKWLSHHAISFLRHSDSIVSQQEKIKRLNITCAPARLLEQIDREIEANIYCKLTDSVLRQYSNIDRKALFHLALRDGVAPLVYGDTNTLCAQELAAKLNLYSPAITQQTCQLFFYYFFYYLFRKNILTHQGSTVFTLNREIVSHAT